MEFILERYNYWIIIVLMMGGLYIVFDSENMIKKLVGLSIFQTSVIVFYVTLGKVAGATAPILVDTGHHGEDTHGADTHGAAPHAEASHAAAGHEAAADVVDHHVSDVAADHSADSGHADVAHADVGHGVDAAHDVAGDVVSAAAHASHASDAVLYSNPLPHVLMLTAIVVGVATLSVGLALVVRIREAYGTIEMDDVRAADIAEGETEGSAS